MSPIQTTIRNGNFPLSTCRARLVRDPRATSLALALAIYAVYGSPTPAAFGLTETLIGLCLLVAIGARRFASVTTGFVLWHSDNETRFLAMCFLLLLLPLTMVGLLNGHPVGDVLRDIIPLGFFFLPLFLHCVDDRLLARCLIAVGVIFAARFWPTSGINILRFGEDRSDEKFLYLSNSPSLLFAGLSLVFIATDPVKRPVLWRCLALAGSVLCLGVLALTLQRGALLLGAVSLYAVFFYRLLRTPHFLYGLFVATMLILAFFGADVMELMSLIWNKTQTVGDNARIAEFKSVLAVLGDEPWAYLFGKGWGAKVTTAASGHAEVRYTHSLISYALLKGGAIGLLATAGYGTILARAAWRGVWKKPLVIAAAAPSLVLGFTVYPSFKMLCFGAMLALISSVARLQGSADAPD